MTHPSAPADIQMNIHSHFVSNPLWTLGCQCLPIHSPPPWPHVVHSSHPDQPLWRWPPSGLQGPMLLAISIGWARAPCDLPEARAAGEQRSRVVAAPDLGGCLGSWIPDPGSCRRRWGRSGPTRCLGHGPAHAPASLGLQMSHCAQALPGGPGWAGGSGGSSATPANPPQAQGGAGARSLRVQKVEKGGRMLSAPEGVRTSQRSGEATLHLLSFCLTGSLSFPGW